VGLAFAQLTGTFQVQQVFRRTALAVMTSTLPFGVAHADDGAELRFGAAPRWEDAETGNYFKLRGRVYIDAATSEWETVGGTLSSTGTEFRTARLGVEGRWFSWGYKAEFDFAGDEVTAKDAILSYRGDGYTVNFGNQKTPNSLDEQTSSLYTTFMERGTVTDLFGLDRRIGVTFKTGGDTYSFAAGVFGGQTGDLSSSTMSDETSALAARLTFTPVNTDDLVIHFGGSLRAMDYADQGARIRARPRTHTSGRIVTADFRPGRALGQADSSLLYGVEAAMISGPFHGHAEYMNLEMDGPAGDPGFDSYFVNLGWFLTGETRAYQAASGAFRRTSPRAPVSQGGSGAWELAARYDFSDLNDVNEGELTTWTLGLNWYAEKYVRFMANYVDGTLAMPGSADTDVSAFQLRAQWDF
jgi:phosphate-selective porin OprO/OprP